MILPWSVDMTGDGVPDILLPTDLLIQGSLHLQE